MSDPKGLVLFLLVVVGIVLFLRKAFRDAEAKGRAMGRAELEAERCSGLADENEV